MSDSTTVLTPSLSKKRRLQKGGGNDVDTSILIVTREVADESDNMNQSGNDIDEEESIHDDKGAKAKLENTSMRGIGTGGGEPPTQNKDLTQKKISITVWITNLRVLFREFLSSRQDGVFLVDTRSNGTLKENYKKNQKVRWCFVQRQMLVNRFCAKTFTNTH